MGRQACLDHWTDPDYLGFSVVPALGHRVRPIRLGSRVSPAHLDRQVHFQIYNELKT